MNLTAMESIRLFRQVARAASSASHQADGGYICGVVPNVATSDVVTVRPVNTPRSASTPRGIRLPPASSLGRLGFSIIGTVR